MKASRTNPELIVGSFVLAGMIAIAVLALKIGSGVWIGADTYVIEARFSNLGGLNPGSSVLIAGVSVGRVEAVRLNDDYSATVKLRVRGGIKLPIDSMAAIKTSGLIGDKYLALSPGADARLLAAGGLITETESAIDLESLISRFAFGSVQANTGKGSK